MKKVIVSVMLIGGLISPTISAKTEMDVLKSENIFDIEYAADLNISADGKTIYFVRHFMDIQSDRKLGNIWSVDSKTGDMLPVTTGDHLDYNPVLSADGKKLAYISTQSGKPQIYLTWLATGKTAKLTNLTSSPSGLSWSPDGKYIAFSMFVPGTPKSPVSLSGKPAGAKWADPAIYIDDVYYRFDGGGYRTPGTSEIFILSAEGGTPRQLTHDEFDNGGELSWGQNSQRIYFSANRSENRDFTPLNSDIYAISIDDNSITQLTDRDGPDDSPKVSPNGKYIAYIGFDDARKNYDNAKVYVKQLSDGETIMVSDGLDRSIDRVEWDHKSRNLYIQYDDKGKTILALQSARTADKRTILSDKLGGQSYGRPYTSGEFSVSENGKVAITYSNPLRPADVGIIDNKKSKQLTHLNDDALGHKKLAKIEEFWFTSSADGKDIQGWIAYPPGFDANKKYPMILEIHGGPVTAYGPHFSMEIQLFAAAGNVVLYLNPRGSSSYGADFAHTIDKNYPSQDFDDLMSGVDKLIEKGFIDTEQLFITGGSGGGTLTAWSIGHTQRFTAAVVAKPVINWFSFVLTADFYPFFYQYWFNGKPWDNLDEYMRYSPISYVGNVTTPTMLLTGESDHRTPISESEQFYQALKIQGVDSAMVRIPNASHGIYRKPSNLMAKVEYILWWFEQHKPKKEGDS
ncbi:S9 family peptidase [Aliiglaciecola sp. 3_MG-2023]|uniref:S9 family peptidase n=1 Tax=Aliiglaciecola sp. 3_MG-2023 TaxID=3062644 RepID=UPI0026E46AD7|nr:S9 family peptidase [Aliiglaciecola sp. 3_MG-2023]MDO6692436.1 S9 family peptidase [Aliiglaciecola sp. 3_MG-2023]